MASSPISSELTIEQLKAVIEDLQAAEAAAIEDRDLADREVRRLRREVGTLRSELQEVREADPKSKLIREVCDYWMKALGKSSRTKCPANGARWNKVRCRFNDGFGSDQLKKAIDGCAAMPFVGPRGRQATPEGGAKRHDDLELICRDETTVERFIGYVTQAEEQRIVDAVGRGIERSEQEEREQAASDAKKDKRRANRLRVVGDPTPPIDRVLAVAQAGKVIAHQGRPDHWTAQCPAHDDSNPSLGIHRGDDGRVLLFCRAGCSTEAVLAAWGLNFRDLYESAERDTNAAAAPFRPERGIPGHLRLEMQRLLRDGDPA